MDMDRIHANDILKNLEELEKEGFTPNLEGISQMFIIVGGDYFCQNKPETPLRKIYSLIKDALNEINGEATINVRGVINELEKYCKENRDEEEFHSNPEVNKNRGLVAGY